MKFSISITGEHVENSRARNSDTAVSNLWDVPEPGAKKKPKKAKKKS